MLKPLYCMIAVLLQCMCWCQSLSVAGTDTLAPSTQNRPRLKIISIVSTSNDVNTPLWTRGEELIPGALLAAKEVNSILSGFHIEIVPLLVQDCSMSEGALEIVQELLTTDTPAVGVTGLFCHKLAKVLSPLLNSDKINLLQLSGTTINYTPENRYLNFFSIVPGIEMQIKSLFDLMEKLNWNKFNIVSGRTSGENDYYIRAAEVLVNSLAESNHSFQYMLNFEIDSSEGEILIKKLRASTSSIIVALLPPGTAADLLCHAFKNKMTWPRYVWIMLDLTVNEMAQCGDGSLLTAMENVIVIDVILEQNNNVMLVSNNAYQNYLDKVNQIHLPSSHTEHNPYTNVLYDSVWALSLALNSSLQTLKYYNQTLTTKSVFGTVSKEVTQTVKENLFLTTFTGASGKFSDNQIHNFLEIHQIRNESFVSIGKCCFNDSTLFQLESLDDTIPGDEIPRVYQSIPFAASVTMTTIVGICVMCTTALLVIFLCYWKESEVRASSRTLSLCIFLGCYLLLASALGNGIEGVMEPGQVLESTCILIVGSSAIGLDVILATVLAKTMRITYVFTKFKKTGKKCSDIALLVFVASIVLGKITIFALWCIVDFYHIVEVQELATDQTGLPQYDVYLRCYSRDAGVWVVLMFSYSGVISVLLAVLAYRTRKIKRQHFKDTKKINGFIISLLMVCAICTPLWGVLRVVGSYQASIYIGTIAYTAVPVMSQLFLIIPKIAPSLKKTLFSVCVCKSSPDERERQRIPLVHI